MLIILNIARDKIQMRHPSLLMLSDLFYLYFLSYMFETMQRKIKLKFQSTRIAKNRIRNTNNKKCCVRTIKFENLLPDLKMMT